MLSSLTSLRVLRCGFFNEPELVAEDPLPVQFHFLRSATALEELDLGFFASFWSLPELSTRAMRAAVSALSRLKKVKILVDTPEVGLEHYYAPLAAFASAPSIESLSYLVEHLVDEVPSREALDQARGCFTALASLQSLHVNLAGPWLAKPSSMVCGIIPDCVGLLSQLPSNRLTSLWLECATASAPLMEQTAQFGGLQDLDLCCRRVSLQFLDPLFDLRSLTRLSLGINPGCTEGLPVGAVGATKAQCERLKRAIMESSRVVGREADVVTSAVDDALNFLQEGNGEADHEIG